MKALRGWGLGISVPCSAFHRSLSISSLAAGLYARHTLLLPVENEITDSNSLLKVTPAPDASVMEEDGAVH